MKKEIITKDIRKQGKVDAGVALETLVGNVLGMVVWLAEGEQDGNSVGSAVGDSDGTQLRALRRRHHAGSTVRLRAGSAGWLGRLACRRATQSALLSETRAASSWDTATYAFFW